MVNKRSGSWIASDRWVHELFGNLKTELRPPLDAPNAPPEQWIQYRGQTPQEFLRDIENHDREGEGTENRTSTVEDDVNVLQHTKMTLKHGAHISSQEECQCCEALERIFRYFSYGYSDNSYPQEITDVIKEIFTHAGDTSDGTLQKKIRNILQRYEEVAREILGQNVYDNSFYSQDTDQNN